MPRISEYETEEGAVPFRRWFSGLGAKAALKVRTAIAQMEAGNFGDHKSVGNGVWERRIHFEKGYRVYFAKDEVELVILFCGGTKTRQQADVAKAKDFWSQYKARKKQAKSEQEAREQEAKPHGRRQERKRRK